MKIWGCSVWLPPDGGEDLSMDRMNRNLLEDTMTEQVSVIITKSNVILTFIDSVGF